MVFLGGYYLARLASAEKRPKCELILLLLYFDVCTTYGPYSHVFMSIKGKLLHVLVTLLTFFPAVAEKKNKTLYLIVRWYVFVYFFLHIEYLILERPLKFLIRVLNFLFFFGNFSYLHGLIRTYMFICFWEKMSPILLLGTHAY